MSRLLFMSLAGPFPGCCYLISSRLTHFRDCDHVRSAAANILVSCVDCSVRIADFGLSRVVSPEIVARDVAASSPQLSPLQQRHSKGSRDDPHADIDLDAEWEMEEVEVNEDGEEKRGPRLSPALPSRLSDQVFNDSRSRQHHTEQSQRHITFAEDTTGGTSSGQSSLPAPVPGGMAGAAPPAVAGRMPPRPVEALKRSLTKHVITRWYRAPEVILCQPCTCSPPPVTHKYWPLSRILTHISLSD